VAEPPRRVGGLLGGVARFGGFAPPPVV